MPTTTPITLRILEAAGSLFAQQGFRLTTTREIAVQAGVNQTTLFRQFKGGKHQISLSAIDFLAKKANIQEKLDSAFRMCDPNNPQTIEAIFYVCFAICTQHLKFVRILVNALTEKSGSDGTNDLRAEVRSKYTMPLSAYVHTFCTTSVKVGAMTGDGSINAGTLLGMLLGKLHGYVISEGEDVPKDLSQAASLAHTLIYTWLNGCSTNPAVSYQLGEPLFPEFLTAEEQYPKQSLQPSKDLKSLSTTPEEVLLKKVRFG